MTVLPCDDHGLVLVGIIGRVEGPTPRTVTVVDNRTERSSKLDGIARVRIRKSAGLRRGLSFNHSCATLDNGQVVLANHLDCDGCCVGDALLIGNRVVERVGGDRAVRQCGELPVGIVEHS